MNNEKKFEEKENKYASAKSTESKTLNESGLNVHLPFVGGSISGLPNASLEDDHAAEKVIAPRAVGKHKKILQEKIEYLNDPLLHRLVIIRLNRQIRLLLL